MAAAHPHRVAALIVALLMMADGAALAASRQSRPPHPRPTPAGEAAEARAKHPPEGAAPLPHPRPVPAGEAAEAPDERPPEGAAPLPKPRPASPKAEEKVPEPEAAPAPPPAVGPEEAACLERLPSLGVEFSRLEPIGGQCGVGAPLAVTALGSNVTITPKATLNCRTAEALALWLRDVVVPAAKADLHATPNRFVQASTYVCRPRNNIEGAKLSEHGHANAADIGSIGFSDRPPLDIHAGKTAFEPSDRFMEDVRRGACKYFKTVLGPLSDPSHATHFHLDMAERRSGYRLCQ